MLCETNLDRYNECTLSSSLSILYVLISKQMPRNMKNKNKKNSNLNDEKPNQSHESLCNLCLIQTESCCIVCRSSQWKLLSAVWYHHLWIKMSVLMLGWAPWMNSEDCVKSERKSPVSAKGWGFKELFISLFALNLKITPESWRVLSGL